MKAAAFLLLLLGIHIFVGDGTARLAGVAGLGLWMVFDPLDDRRVKMFLASILLLLVSVFVPAALAFFHPPNPLRYDLYLHALDHGIGFCVPQYFFGLVRSSPALARLTIGLYQLLPAMMLAGYGWALYSSPEANACLLSYLFSAVSAWLYWIVPAAGPVFVLGATLASPHPTPAVSLIQVPFASNCIPSMHLSTAICAWYFSRKHELGRRISLAYIFITVFATLALGEHYIIDLVVALPFVVFLVAAAIEKYWEAITALAVTLAWLLAIRFKIYLLLDHGAITWILLGATALVSVWVIGKLPASQTPNSQAVAADGNSAQPAL